VKEADASLVALKERLIFGEIVYDLVLCGLNHRVRINDEKHDENHLTATPRSRQDQSEWMTKGQHDLYSRV